MHKFVVAVEFEISKGWNRLCIEYDSSLVVSALKNHHLVPWKLRNRWSNFILATQGMQFAVTHIHREGNCCANKLAGYGSRHSGTIWWDLAPDFIKEDFDRNRLGLPNFRFT